MTYPEMYERFLGAVDVFNLDLVWVVSPGCFVDVTLYDRLLAVTFGPVVVLVALSANYRVVRRGRARKERDSTRSVREKHVSVFLLVTFLVYSTVSKVVFQTFACDELDDGTTYLRADHRQECTTEKHRIIEVFAGLMIAVYPVGIPLLYAALLCTSRCHITHSKRGEILRVRYFQVLWKPYRKTRYYYEVVEYVRRVALTGVVVFISPSSSAQIAVTFLLALFFFAAFELLNPYETWQYSWLSRLGHVVVLLSMYLALLLKASVAEEGGGIQEAFSAVLVTTNAAMIVAVVVECLSVYWYVGQSRATELPRRRVGVEKTVSIMDDAEEEEEYYLPSYSYEEDTAVSGEAVELLVYAGGQHFRPMVCVVVRRNISACFVVYTRLDLVRLLFLTDETEKGTTSILGALSVCGCKSYSPGASTGLGATVNRRLLYCYFQNVL